MNHTRRRTATKQLELGIRHREAASSAAIAGYLSTSADVA
jgi:hypothetical protein